MNERHQTNGTARAHRLINSGFVRRVETRMPTRHGDARLCLYEAPWEPGDHLALVFGDVAASDDVLVRIHSECLTGDLLGSQRCDCGDQLERAMTVIARAGRGVVIYLRQEGRGIGLANKLKAYNLQDQGHDTVTANVLLGRGVDERDYRVAAEILRDLEVRSVHLLTNNPDKLDGLRERGVKATARVALPPQPTPHNRLYLQTKVERMRHMFDMAGPGPEAVEVARQNSGDARALLASLRLPGPAVVPGDQGPRPFVTLSYAQSLDGSIATVARAALQLSGHEALSLAHAARSAHDAILVGIDTVLSDDPRLDVRLVDGPSPQAVVADSNLRAPVSARLFSHGNRQPWFAASVRADKTREQALCERGARVFRLPVGASGRVDLAAMLRRLYAAGIRSVMVEGGARIITSLLRQELIDHLLVSVTPRLVGGLNAIEPHQSLDVSAYADLEQPRYLRLGDDIVVSARPTWKRAAG